MKILHIITGLETGGAERALYNLLAGGLAKQFDCTVLSLRDEGTMGASIRQLGVSVQTLGLRAGASTPTAFLKLRRVVSDLQPDIVQGWMYHGNLAAWFAAKMVSGQRAVAWNVRHSIYDLQNEKWLTRQLIRVGRKLSGGTDAIIYNSQISRNQHERFGFAANRSVVIPNGFDVKNLQPNPLVGAKVRRELGIASDTLVVGHVARLHPIKDHAGFLRAAVEVAQRSKNTRFLLVGRDVKPENPAFAGIIPPDLLEHFIFTGERHDVPNLMQAMNVFCLSSISEAFPNVLGEAMACAIPCVATDVGDSATIIGETGYVVPPSDPTALTQALLSMLAISTEIRADLGQLARMRIVANYGIDAIVARYAGLYEKLMNARSDM